MADKPKRSLRDLLPGGERPGSDAMSLRPAIIWLVLILSVLTLATVVQRGQKPVVSLETWELDEQIDRTNTPLRTLVFRGEENVDGEIEVRPDDDSLKKWVEKYKITQPVKLRYVATVFTSDLVVKDIKSRCAERGIKYDTKLSSGAWKQVMWSIMPLVLLIGVIAFFINRQMKRGIGMAMNFGRSRARMNAKNKDRTTFADLAGCDEAKEEVSEIVDYLRDPKKFERLGGRIPRGVILIGPPGTGKTLLAKAIAGEAEVPFFSISGSDFVEMFVGVGAARVRDLFEQGKRNAPCIIFVDEIDAVGRLRGAGLGGGHDEREQTLNALLVEMDGFTPNDGVIILAATNRPDVLDPALLRPGRFDRQIVIDMPDQKGREEILKIHTRKVKLDERVDLSRIARGTPGFSGADLANLVNEAALTAARQNCPSVSQQYFEEARDKVRFGRERKSKVMDDRDRRITAYHEGGHALVTVVVPECEPIHKVTIIPRGIAYLGATMQLPAKDRYHYTKKEIEGQLVSLMGGRVAEEMEFGDFTSGARSDIKQATDIARKMVCEWGMSDVMGPLAYGEREEHLFLGREIERHRDYSDQTAQKIDGEIRRVIDQAYDRARAILSSHRSALDAIAAALLKYEVLEGDEIKTLAGGGPIRDDAKPAAPVAEPAASPAPPPDAPPPAPDDMLNLFGGPPPGGAKT